MNEDEFLKTQEELPGIRCDVKGPPGPMPFDPNSLPDKEYFEWLNKQQLSKKEYYRLYVKRLKYRKEFLAFLKRENLTDE